MCSFRSKQSENKQYLCTTFISPFCTTDGSNSEQVYHTLTCTSSRELSVSAATEVIYGDLATSVDCTEVRLRLWSINKSQYRDVLAGHSDVMHVSITEASDWRGEAGNTNSMPALATDECHVTLDWSQTTAETPVDSTFAHLTVDLSSDSPSRWRVSRTTISTSVESDCIQQKSNVNETYVDRFCNDAEKEPEVDFVSATSANTDGTTSCISSSRGSVISSKCPTCGCVTRQLIVTDISTSPPFSGVMSTDLLTKVLRQNARLKQTLRDVISQQGTTPDTYLSIRERDDVIIQLRQELNGYRLRYRALRDQVKTLTQTHVTAESVGLSKIQRQRH